MPYILNEGRYSNKGEKPTYRGKAPVRIIHSDKSKSDKPKSQSKAKKFFKGLLKRQPPSKRQENRARVKKRAKQILHNYKQSTKHSRKSQSLDSLMNFNNSMGINPMQTDFIRGYNAQRNVSLNTGSMKASGYGKMEMSYNKRQKKYIQDNFM